MMKAGKIVDRGSPQALIDRYGRTNLEEVFLHIARAIAARAGAGVVTARRVRRRQRLLAGRVWAMLLRYLYLLRSSWPRTLELLYWPTLQMLIWGFMSQFLYVNSNYVFARLRRAAGRGDAVGRDVPQPARPVDLVSRRDVGAQPRASVRHPAAPYEWVACRCWR